MRDLWTSLGTWTGGHFGSLVENAHPPTVTGSCLASVGLGQGRFGKHNSRVLWHLAVGVPSMVGVPVTFAHDRVLILSLVSHLFNSVGTQSHLGFSK